MKQIMILAVVILFAGVSAAQEIHVIADDMPWGGPASLTDIDGDYDLDILYNDFHRVLWMENNGSGHFKKHLLFEIDLFAFSITTADLNNDGHLDILLSDAENGEIWYNDGNMNFSPSNTHNFVYAATGDFDNDNDVDFFASKSSGGEYFAYVYLNDGNGSFFEGMNWSGNIHNERDVFLIGDVDGDGHWDFYGISEEWGIIYDFYTYGYSYTGPMPVRARTMVDIDWDGDQDLVGFQVGSYKVVQAEQTAPREFSLSAIGTMHQDGRDMGSLNLNQDLYPDLVLNGASEEMQMFSNYVAGFMSNDFDILGTLDRFETGDIDGDGDDDLLCYTLARVYWIENDFELPAISIQLFPQQRPVTIPAAGGMFRYNGGILNMLTEPQTGQLWATVVLPDGTELDLWQNTLDLLPRHPEAVWNVQQVIPESAPAGQYVFKVMAGQYPDHPVAADTFPFTKEASTDQLEHGGENPSRTLDPATRQTRLERIARATAQPWPVSNDNE